MYITDRQQTLNSEISFSGIGLHSGETVAVRLLPAVADTGVKFVFSNNDGYEVYASLANVKSTLYATSLEHNFNSIGTIEHLLAALFAHQIDNCIIQVSGNEIPILDGSSAFFSKSILEVGITKQHKKAKLFRLPDATFSCKNSIIKTKPHDSKLIITAEINFKGVLQRITVDINQETFHTDIANSRTFVHSDDIDKLKKMNLIKGGSLDNAIVLSDDGIINPYNIVFEDDLVRHKIIDVLGDFSLCGTRLVGEIYIFQPGHTVNIYFIKQLTDIINGTNHQTS